MKSQLEAFIERGADSAFPWPYAADVHTETIFQRNDYKLGANSLLPIVEILMDALEKVEAAQGGIWSPPLPADLKNIEYKHIPVAVNFIAREAKAKIEDMIK